MAIKTLVNPCCHSCHSWYGWMMLDVHPMGPTVPEAFGSSKSRTICTSEQPGFCSNSAADSVDVLAEFWNTTTVAPQIRDVPKSVAKIWGMYIIRPTRTLWHMLQTSCSAESAESTSWMIEKNGPQMF